jgi:dihydrofolate synthase/folylpolyglutamate synthase
MDLLGDTFEKIALEKAGIIKEGVPVVISETQPETEGVFKSVAKTRHSDLIFADKVFSCILGSNDPSEGERRYLVTEIGSGKEIEGTTPLGGDYQSKNIPAVYAAFSKLEGRISVSAENVMEGIRKVVTNTGLNGRWQIRGRNPLIICDTGHNKEGLEYVTGQLSRIGKQKLHMIIGFVNDKDLSLVLPLLPRDAVFYFTKASVSRALDENLLKSKAIESGLKGESYPDVKSALHAAKIAASREDVIFVGGSTFIVADFLSV